MKAKLYGKVCSITGQPMNEGWYCPDLAMYFKHEHHAIMFAQAHTYIDDWFLQEYKAPKAPELLGAAVINGITYEVSIYNNN
jgi:hypothetical protein